MFQTFTSKEYLKIDIANNFGLDKDDWDIRIAWFDNNEPILEDLVKQAGEPALYFAGVKAWRKVQLGQAIGYPISLDATSSGLQILSILRGCRTSASQCNVVDTGHREDAYNNNYNNMCEIIGEEGKIDRKETKKALMTALYASKKIPRDTFGEGSELLATFYDSVKQLMPGAWELNEALLDLWNPNAYSHDWVLPDNFHVHVAVYGTQKANVHAFNRPYEVTYTVNGPQDEGRSICPNIVHSIDGMIVREMLGRCNYDPAQMLKVYHALGHKGKSTHRESDKLVMTLWGHYLDSGFLSVRILDHLDSLNMGHVDPEAIKALMDTMPKKPFEIISVHDCFRVLPNYGNDVRRCYNQILHEIAKSQMLEFIVEKLTGRRVPVQKVDDFADEILEANYALS